MEELEAGIKSSRYYAGILKCTRNQAYVNGGGQLGRDILIVGSENMNRAGNQSSVHDCNTQFNVFISSARGHGCRGAIF